MYCPAGLAVTTQLHLSDQTDRATPNPLTRPQLPVIQHGMRFGRDGSVEGVKGGVQLMQIESGKAPEQFLVVHSCTKLFPSDSEQF